MATDFTDLPDALAEIARLTAQVETLQGERDEAVRRIPTEQPDQGGWLVLNAYGRACYDSGRERAGAKLDRLRARLLAWCDEPLATENDLGMALCAMGMVPEHAEIAAAAAHRAIRDTINEVRDRLTATTNDEDR